MNAKIANIIDNSCKVPAKKSACPISFKQETSQDVYGASKQCEF